MSRMIISLVISIFLVMSPVIGQFIDQQTALYTQESLHIENTANPVEHNGTSSDSFIETKTSSKAHVSDRNAIPEAGKEVLEKAETTEEGTKAQQGQGVEATQSNKEIQPKQPAPQSIPNNKPVPTVRPESSSKPTAESKPTAKPVATPQPESTTSQQAPVPKPTTIEQPTKSPEAGETPKPTATPKPSEPPEAPAQTESSTTESTSSSNENVFDTSKVNSGTLGVRYLNTSGKRVKLMVEKGDSRYTYNLDGKGSLETFPLQSGNGEYTVSIMENTEGSKYRFVITEKVRVNVSDSNSAYLSSIQMVNWNSGMAAIKKAADLTSGASDDETKLKKIYNYVVGNIRYDSDKLNNLPSTYVPVIDNTYQSKSGICYDFASLTAAMLRSVGVPTKLIMGYADGVNGYHAWNEVYIDGKWKVVDTSYDSQMREAGANYSMIKSKSNYQTKKVY